MNKWIKNTGIRPEAKKVIVKFDDNTLNGGGPVTPKLFIWDKYLPAGNIKEFMVYEP